MILTAIDFETVGDRHRVSVLGKLTVKIRAIADDSAAGVVEVRRAYGAGGPEVAYATPVTLDLTGETATELVVDDCPELVIVVTTAGSGDLDIEVATGEPCEDIFEITTEADLGVVGKLWASPTILPGIIERITVVASLADSYVKGAVSIKAELDRRSASSITASSSAVDLQGGATTLTLSAITGLELVTTTKQAGLAADFFIYRVSNPYRGGILPDNVALLDAANTFTEINTFTARTEFDANVKVNDGGKLRLYDADSSAYLGLKSPAVVSGFDGDFDYTLPINPGATGDRLETTALGVLSWYTPKATAGTTFPLSPDDGDLFLRTDLEGELFRWDNTRSKWLGEMLVLSGGYASTIAAGTTRPLETAGDVYFSSSRGYSFPFDMTIVGCTLFNAASSTNATVRWYEGSVSLGTILTLTAARNAEDFTVDLDFDGDSGWPHKYPQIKCEAGAVASINNPAVLIFMRRRAT